MKSGNQPKSKSLLSRLAPTLTLLTGVALLAGATIASAQVPTFGAVAENTAKSVIGLAQLVNVAAYLGGAIFTIVGVFMFKKNRDDPRGTTMGSAITCFVVGVALLFFPTVVAMGGKTLFGDGGTTVKGDSKTFDIPK